jgi:hypothetical protein
LVSEKSQLPECQVAAMFLRCARYVRASSAEPNRSSVEGSGTGALVM